MSELLPKVLNNLGENPYFGAGFGLVGVGAVLAGARQASAFAITLLRRHYLMTLEITHRDQAYPWVLNWLNHHHKSAQHLGVATQLFKKSSGNYQSQFDFVPCVGTHYVQFNKKWMKIERERNQTVVDPFETIKFTCIGNDKSILSNLLKEASDLELSKHKGKTLTYTARTTEWEPCREPRNIRDFNTVTLDGNISEMILSDINKFLRSREKYLKRAIPYKRGYLLYGPPGCGKTSFITALAGKLEYDICRMNLSDLALSDDRLEYLLGIAPSNSIILMEDVEGAFSNRGEIDYSAPVYQGLRKLTFSGITNALDGVDSPERIIFMTTNNLERIPKVLIRPGRVDMQVKIGFASDQQLGKAFEMFYPKPEFNPKPDRFVAAINNSCKRLKLQRAKLNLSMAEVQSHFLLHEENDEDAIAGVESWLKDRESQKSVEKQTALSKADC